jgi:hypothetical protein
VGGGDDAVAVGEVRGVPGAVGLDLGEGQRVALAVPAGEALGQRLQAFPLRGGGVEVGQPDGVAACGDACPAAQPREQPGARRADLVDADAAVVVGVDDLEQRGVAEQLRQGGAGRSPPGAVDLLDGVEVAGVAQVRLWDPAEGIEDELRHGGLRRGGPPIALDQGWP